MLVGFVLALESVVFAAIAPLLPQYVAEHQLSEGMAGVLVAAYPIGILLGTAPAVAMSAKAGSRAALLGGLSVLGVATAVFGFADATASLLAARLTQGLGAAFAWVGGLSLLFRLVPPENKGGLVGKVLGAAVLGLTIGPLVGGLASEIGREPVFLTAAIACFMLVLAARRVAAVDERPKEDRFSRGQISSEILAALWIVCLASVFASSIEVLVPLRLADFAVGGPMIGAVFVCAALLEALASPRAGRISDAGGARGVIGFGLIATAFVSLGLALADTLALLIPATVCMAAALAALSAPAAASLSNASERAGFDQASAAGLLNIAWSGGGVIGGVAAGGLAGALGWDAPFVVLAAIALTTLGLIGRRSRIGRGRCG